MQPYKRRRRTRRDMIVLGGWLFADLLLGLAMLFAVANTVGAPPPEPTPTPMPDYLATAESDISQIEASSQQTVEALQGQLIDQESAADATRDAEATRAALSAEERATVDAGATANAVAAQATIEAFSTERAANQSSQAELNSDLATTAAQATEISAQVDAQGTEQAELAAVATANAESGVVAQGTMAALEDEVARNAVAQSTAEAMEAAARQDAEEARATSAAAQDQLSQAEQQIQLNSLNPNAVTQTIQVDLNGVLGGDQDALAEARDELESVLGPYINGESCRIGFVNISSRAQELGEGVQLSESIADIIQEEFPQLLPEPTEGGQPQLASESIALPGTEPAGEVELQLFLSSGCEPAG